MHDWREAMQRLDGIERLSDKLTEQDRAEDERKSGVELDDLVVMRWERTP
jgi:flagellar biosynthesis chaperone FliJ